MSVSTVITLGYGSFGSVNRIPTLGYGGTTLIYGPGRVVAACVYRPGMMAGEVYQPGARAAEVYRPGMMAGEVGPG